MLLHKKEIKNLTHTHATLQIFDQKCLTTCWSTFPLLFHTTDPLADFPTDIVTLFDSVFSFHSTSLLGHKQGIWTGLHPTLYFKRVGLRTCACNCLSILLLPKNQNCYYLFVHFGEQVFQLQASPKNHLLRPS